MSNAFYDLEGSIETLGKLAGDRLRAPYSRLSARAKLKENPISYLVVHVASFSVSLGFHGSLGLEEFISDGLEGVIPVNQHFIHNINVRRT